MRSCTDVPNTSIVFLRAGMDVPLQDGRITDTSRIDETRPTIDLLREKGCKIIVATSIGRPKGNDPSLSTKPVADHLAQFYPTRFVAKYQEVQAVLAAMQPGELLVPENLLFDAREKDGDDAYARELVAPVDCVVQDAYSKCHRSEASIVAITKHKPAYAGLLLEKELRGMQPFLNPEHPFVAIIGGAKADKLGTIRGLLTKLDAVLVGGVLANTFLKAAGFSVGESKVDETGLEEAKALYDTGKIILPADAVVADAFARDASNRTLDIGGVAKGFILDIGPKTVERYSTYLFNARTVVWAGPIGVFEWESFAGGTRAIAAAVAEATGKGCKTLAAGGDSGAALVALGYKERISHVSTGGGVTLELLEGKALPGVVALEENQQRFL